MERKEDLKARIVFMGTPHFAVATLDALKLAGNQIIGGGKLLPTVLRVEGRRLEHPQLRNMRLPKA